MEKPCRLINSVKDNTEDAIMKIVFWGIFITIVIVLTLIASQYLKEPDGLSGSAGEIVELTFEFDKKPGLVNITLIWPMEKAPHIHYASA